MIEAHGFARRLPYHHHKLTLVFAAMRQFRDRLLETGYDVTYLQTETFGEGFEQFFADNPDATLVAMESPSYGSGDRFADLVADAGGDLRLVESHAFRLLRPRLTGPGRLQQQRGEPIIGSPLGIIVMMVTLRSRRRSRPCGRDRRQSHHRPCPRQRRRGRR